jgi:hypothetical protein
MVALTREDWLAIPLEFRVRALHGQNHGEIIKGALYTVVKLNFGYGAEWTGHLFIRDESGHVRKYFYANFVPDPIPENVILREAQYASDPMLGQF